MAKVLSAGEAPLLTSHNANAFDPLAGDLKGSRECALASVSALTLNIRQDDSRRAEGRSGVTASNHRGAFVAAGPTGSIVQ